ncbi:MAG: 16S rRNA (cytosine(1402)-N(4))-methyltransferase RsmH [Burkholderiales bacterium]
MSLGSRHESVLLSEAVEALNIRPDGVYVDCTFGRGGHSRRILQKLGADGRLMALDRDPQAIAAAAEMDDTRFTAVRSRFSRLQAVLTDAAIGKVDGILMDLGVSSTQLDDAQRGFSFRRDGPLDMRMGPDCGQSAQQWLVGVTERQLGEVIKIYGEERFAKQVARAIVAQRAHGSIDTTGKLAQIVAKAVKKRERGQDPATRTFQAIRIYLNQELEELSLALPQCVAALKPGGRLAVISFHSLEDRIVKRFMRAAAQQDHLPQGLPVRAADMAAPRLKLVGKALRPSVREVERNARARSAVMRVAERTEAQ